MFQPTITSTPLFLALNGVMCDIEQHGATHELQVAQSDHSLYGSSLSSWGHHTLEALIYVPDQNAFQLSRCLESLPPSLHPSGLYSAWAPRMP